MLMRWLLEAGLVARGTNPNDQKAETLSPTPTSGERRGFNWINHQQAKIQSVMLTWSRHKIHPTTGFRGLPGSERVEVPGGRCAWRGRGSCAPFPTLVPCTSSCCLFLTCARYTTPVPSRAFSWVLWAILAKYGPRGGTWGSLGLYTGIYTFWLVRGLCSRGSRLVCEVGAVLCDWAFTLGSVLTLGSVQGCVE